MEDLIQDALSRGLISFEHTDWLQRAIEQKAHRLTIALAHSKKLLLIQDALSEGLATVLPIETNPINWN